MKILLLTAIALSSFVVDLSAQNMSTCIIDYSLPYIINEKAIIIIGSSNCYYCGKADSEIQQILLAENDSIPFIYYDIDFNNNMYSILDTAVYEKIKYLDYPSECGIVTKVIPQIILLDNNGTTRKFNGWKSSWAKKVIKWLNRMS